MTLPGSPAGYRPPVRDDRDQATTDPADSPGARAAVPVVLASASPARLAALRSVGIRPEVVVSDVDEPAAAAASGATEAADVVLVLARAKAEEVASRVEDAVVIGCDSLLELDGHAVGKPADAAEATARWRAMRGRSGVLHTGHWLVDTRLDHEPALGATESTTVHFADLSDEEIDAYVATGEPLRVAGAFTVDGRGAAFVTRIEGNHHNVVGISLPLVRTMLAQLDIAWYDVVG